MQIDNNNRAGIITASTLVGAGAGVTAGNYMPLVNAKRQATSDRFVKEVANEMNGNKAVNLLNAAAAKDYLDTVFVDKKGYNATGEQIDKFFNRFGDMFEIKREQFKDEKGKPLGPKALGKKLNEIVDAKIAENGEVKFSDGSKKLELVFDTTADEAKALIKDGFDKKKNLVKAGTTISEEGHDALKRAIKTVKNERMIKGGLIAGAIALAASTVATCQRD
ncbi:MAG: hypothetical protein NC390_01160 [Fusobacterium sp.]|nr:hypothetical protein [Fusobacterium sp.]